MGGVLAYRAAARREDIAGLALLAPGFSITSRFLLELKATASREGSAVFTEAGREYRVSRAFFESRDFDPIALAPRVTVPTLIAIGDLDYTVDREACRGVADALERGSFIIAQGEGHDLTGLSYWPALASFISRFEPEGRGI